MNVGADAPPGVYEVTISSESGFYAMGMFWVTAAIELEDPVEGGPVCTPVPFMLGEDDAVDVPVATIYDCTTADPAVAYCGFVPGLDNAGTLTIHCLQAGATTTGTVVFQPKWDGTGDAEPTTTASFRVICPEEDK